MRSGDAGAEGGTDFVAGGAGARGRKGREIKG